VRARELIQEYLADHDRVEVVGTGSTGREALEAIHEQAPGLVFLDVQMPGLDGFDVLERLDTLPDTGDLEERLDSSQFLRVHRSHMIALPAVEHFRSDGSGGYRVRLSDGTTVRVSRSYAADLRDHIM
jgi:DNA-binding LytR/AlgR family response regulator